MTPPGVGQVEAGLLAQALRASADAIVVQDLDGRVVSWNPAATRLYGYEAAEVVGGDGGFLLAGPASERLTEIRDRARGGETIARVDTVQVRRDGSEVPVSLTVSPLRAPDGAVTGLVSSGQDISERVEIARALERAYAELDRRNLDLERSNRQLEQFAYVASHDLSEPLRVISSYVQLLAAKYGDSLDERGHRYVTHVVEAAERMRRLIDGLLTFARIMRQEPAHEPVDLAGVAAEVLSGLGRMVEEAGADVTVGELPVVRGDRTLLSNLLQNLVGNAIKFQRPGVSPGISVRAEPAADGMVRIDVDDNGIGVEAKYRKRVLLMFQRLHVREAYPGTGMGLTIAHETVVRHGGLLWLDDSPAGGCRVSFTLPREAAGGAGDG